jgi:hypothetical protein
VVLRLMVLKVMLLEVAPRAPREMAHGSSPSRRGFALPAGNVVCGPYASHYKGLYMVPLLGSTIAEQRGRGGKAMARYLVLVTSCLFAVSCAKQASNGPAAQSEDAFDVYEAVFRYRLQKHLGDVKPADVKVYLSVDGKDPPAELLQRLRKDWPNLKPVSEEPKEKGYLLYVEGLKWGTRDAVDLKAGYWFPTKVAGQGYFADHHVIREKGRWVVDKVTNETSS